MDVRIFTEPQQGASYDDLLRVAKAAEDLGFSGFFRSDHYLHMGGDGAPGPTDAWTTLAGLARDTSTIRLGTLVSSATFRLPGPLAVQVAGVDQMSGGRVELGLGAGWFEEEHAAFGIPFPSVRGRFDRLEEQLAVITGLWATPAGERFSHRGAHYELRDCPVLTRPAQERLPVIVGGTGPRRTPALAAAYAAEYNVAFQPPEQVAAAFDRVGSACAEIGRAPSELVYSAAQVVCVGDDEATLARRAGNIGRDLDELRANGLAGNADEVRARLEEFADVGVTRIYLQVLDLADLDHLSDIAAALLPRADRPTGPLG
jgi:F420-dependent oxidoreductase-like protein